MRALLLATYAAASWTVVIQPSELRVPAPDGSEVAVRGSAISRGADGSITTAGRSEIVHGPLRISCAGTAVITTSGGYFTSLDAVGEVLAAAGKKTMKAERLEYEETRHLVTLSGRPEVDEDGAIYRAERRILVYLETGVIKCEPRTLMAVEKSYRRERPKPPRRKFLGIF